MVPFIISFRMNSSICVKRYIVRKRSRYEAVNLVLVVFLISSYLEYMRCFAAGQEYHHNQYYGGPANMLCLPNNPELSNRTAPGNSLLVGTEYYDKNFFVTGAQNEDVPCALCRSVNTSASVMIPGRKSCDSGWKIEYNGILASGAYTHKPSSYICLDSHPEFLQGGQDVKTGHLLYATRTKCGSLACPPYADNMAINCVVCSK